MEEIFMANTCFHTISILKVDLIFLNINKYTKMLLLMR